MTISASPTLVPCGSSGHSHVADVGDVKSSVVAPWGLHSLDPEESTPQLLTPTHFHFRHSFWYRQRCRVAAAMTALELSPSVRGRFRWCGWPAWIYQSDDDPPRYKIRTQTCHSRWCVPCQQDRGRIIAANLRKELPDVTLRMLTLTVATQGSDLAAPLNKLINGFQKLRRTKLWRDHVSGGLAILEVNWRRERGRFHPHLHVLLEGQHFPHKHIRALWLSITGDSYIVDIRKVHSHDHACNYLTKYLTKNLGRGIWQHPARLQHAMTVLRGRKLLTTFGTWSKLRLLAVPRDLTDWLPVMDADTLLCAAAHGALEAQSIARALFPKKFDLWMKTHPP